MLELTDLVVHYGAIQALRGVSLKVPTGQVPYALATGAGALWVANANSGTVTRIDASTTRTRTFRTKHRPIAVGGITFRAVLYGIPPLTRSQGDVLPRRATNR